MKKLCKFYVSFFTGWYRKVCKRKNGSRAGRIEVKIVSPTGKTFRSRNELKKFFQNLGETILKPEHFDFSPFASENAPSLLKEYAKNSVVTQKLPEIDATAGDFF